MNPNMQGAWSNRYNSRFKNLRQSRQFGAPLRGWQGSAWKNTNKLGDFGARRFNAFGTNTSYGRAGVTAGLGLLAVRNAGNMMDRMRYGDYGGAMMSGALTAAAGYGAYASWMYKGSMRSHLTKSIGKLLGRTVR